MIAIGTIDNPRAAQALVDYLQGLDIECRLQPDENGVTLYISDHSQLEQAQVEFQKFVENPYQDKYLQASCSMAIVTLNLIMALLGYNFLVNL